MAKAKTKSTPTFTASYRVTVEVGMTIAAPDFDAALAKAKELKFNDVLTLRGDHNDSSDLRLVSIWEQSSI